MSVCFRLYHSQAFVTWRYSLTLDSFRIGTSELYESLMIFYSVIQGSFGNSANFLLQTLVLSSKYFVNMTAVMSSGHGE